MPGSGAGDLRLPGVEVLVYNCPCETIVPAHYQYRAVDRFVGGVFDVVVDLQARSDQELRRARFFFFFCAILATNKNNKKSLSSKPPIILPFTLLCFQNLSVVLY